MLSGASSVITRRTTGGVSYSLMRSRARPATSARITGRALVSRRTVSYDASSRTGTSSSDGSSALTTSQSTIAKNSAAALYASRSVSAALMCRSSETPVSERSPSRPGIYGRTGTWGAPGGASLPTPSADSGMPSS
jgi:hypothetical protein